MSLPSASGSRKFDCVYSGDSRSSRKHDGGALIVGDFDADRGFSGNAIDADGFGFEGKAEVVAESGDPRVFDAGLGFEFEGRDDRAGMDLLNRAHNFEFRGLLFQQRGALRAVRLR